MMVAASEVEGPDGFGYQFRHSMCSSTQKINSSHPHGQNSFRRTWTY